MYLTTVVSTTVTGIVMEVVDLGTRKDKCALSAGLYSLSMFSIFFGGHKHMEMLMIGRIVYGAASALHHSSFENYAINGHTSLGFPEDWLDRQFPSSPMHSYTPHKHSYAPICTHIHTILYYPTLHYTTLHCTTLHYTTLYHTIPHYTTLYRLVQTFSFLTHAMAFMAAISGAVGQIADSMGGEMGCAGIIYTHAH